ncbi:MAG: hypothetical protein OXR03_21635 [Rhodospirillaceae bacterium]|nr:hypothetical protein [Rhodospirillaceae bacterium]
MAALPMGLPELTTISARCGRDGQRTLLFCSTDPGDGASTVSYAMAQRIAGSGKRVLYVDFSPQSSYTCDGLQLPRQNWCLSGGIPRDAYFPIPGRNLTILAAAKAPTYPLAYCETEIIRALLSGWLSEYDVVIADAPPLNDDNKTGLPTETLAAAFDCTVLVVLSGETLLVQLKKALDRLREAGCTIDGIVMNDRQMPDLRAEFSRQIEKIGGKLPRLVTWLKQWVETRRVFSV